MSQAGIEKSAALLLALGEEATAAVFRYLSPLEVNRLGSAMRELEVLPRERVRAILRDYAAESAEQTGFAADTGRFLDETLKQAFRPERAQAMLAAPGGDRRTGDRKTGVARTGRDRRPAGGAAPATDRGGDLAAAA